MIISNLLLAFHLIVALSIIVLVLLQQGKGADMGAAFGGGSSQTLFGARGSANFLTRLTSGLAVIFFLTSLMLAFLFTRQAEDISIVEQSSVIQSAENISVDDISAENITIEVPEIVEAVNQEASDVPAVPE